MSALSGFLLARLPLPAYSYAMTSSVRVRGPRRFYRFEIAQPHIWIGRLACCKHCGGSRFDKDHGLFRCLICRQSLGTIDDWWSAKEAA